VIAFRIWVDADACPGPVKEIVVRAALRLGIPTIFVANKDIQLPASPLLSSVRVAKGADVVDAHIAEAAQAGDLAVTQDIPLAAQLVPKGVVVLSPHGEVFTAENVRERLSIRNFMHDLRQDGVITRGPAAFGNAARQAFANALDRELARAMRR
jgi:uncharacterized protein YaiI (UPF0178 family)